MVANWPCCNCAFFMEEKLNRWIDAFFRRQNPPIRDLDIFDVIVSRLREAVVILRRPQANSARA